MIGIPYAYAYVDERGYYVVCPVCGLECRGVDESQQTDEDAVTKGADAVYAAHYEKEHS